MKQINHVVFTTEGVVLCRHCKASIQLTYPIRLKDCEVVAKTFIKNHKNCKEQTV